MIKFLQTSFTGAAAFWFLMGTSAYAQQHLPTPIEQAKVPIEAAELDAEVAEIDDEAAEVDEKTSGPALWRVSDEDTTVYLFGTVHALPVGIDWFKGNVADALASSDILVTEVMTTPETTAEMQSIIKDKGILPQGETLRGMLSDDQKVSYDAAMAKLGMPNTAFDRFEPWYASMMLSMLPLMKEGYSPGNGVEAVLTKHGGEDKARGQLETLEFQMSVFDELPLPSQIDFLMQAANGVDSIKPMLDSMVAEWLEGDADALAGLMNKGLTDSVLADRLLYQRNLVWADWIDNRLEKPGAVFMAVGAGHLAGDKSVQSALADRGITVCRIQ